jgi:serine/threonine protein kinase
MADLHAKVIKGEYPKLPRHFSKELADVLGHCLTLDPKKRFSAEELLLLP